MDAGTFSFHWHWHNIEYFLFLPEWLLNPCLSEPPAPDSRNRFSEVKNTLHLPETVSIWSSTIYLVGDKCHHTIWISIQNEEHRRWSDESTSTYRMVTKEFVPALGGVSCHLSDYTCLNGFSRHHLWPASGLLLIVQQGLFLNHSELIPKCLLTKTDNCLYPRLCFVPSWLRPPI